ncbi:MAG TPA: hypothetical protein VFA32_16625 [Dehalococcoidia bacterium]|nr:hypothetical protein [Dehalococcoidia bacterium]
MPVPEAGRLVLAASGPYPQVASHEVYTPTLTDSDSESILVVPSQT